jgi:hypothetical protein
MATRTASRRILLTISLFALFVVSLIPAPVSAKTVETATFPEFSNFLQSIYTGEANQLRGVYVPEVMALPVVSQPGNDAGYVSREEETLTRFALADYFGTIGLLAHNYLAGQYFTSLSPGQVVYLVYGGGEVNAYMITQVSRFQANEPYNPYGEFRNLETGITYTAEQTFRQFYTGTPHVTFQTCIAQGDEPSWGRLFVTAIPLTEYYAQQNLSSENDPT